MPSRLGAAVRPAAGAEVVTLFTATPDAEFAQEAGLATGELPVVELETVRSDAKAASLLFD